MVEPKGACRPTNTSMNNLHLTNSIRHQTPTNSTGLNITNTQVVELCGAFQSTTNSIRHLPLCSHLAPTNSTDLNVNNCESQMVEPGGAYRPTTSSARSDVFLTTIFPRISNFSSILSGGRNSCSYLLNTHGKK